MVHVRRETRLDGRLIHDLPWAASRSFTVTSRVSSIPLGVALSVLEWTASAILGTALGGIGATVASVRDAIRHEHRSDRAAHRGFVKGYTVASIAVFGATWLLGIPARVVGVAVGTVGAVALTGPFRLVGVALDRSHSRSAPGAEPTSAPGPGLAIPVAGPTETQLALPGC